MNRHEWIMQMLSYHHGELDKGDQMCYATEIKPKPKSPHVFIAKAEWHSTAKLLKIPARNEDEALEKAYRKKECKGCPRIKIIKEV